jgi:heme a synthase
MDFIKINRRFGIITISSVFLLLLAGGFVRSTGSGMGCPDWPKCYDKLYPPTHVNQLPIGYQFEYVIKRVEKAKKFSKLIAKLGFKKESESILKDPNLFQPEEFNTTKAWIEYINRLIGVLSGLFSLVFFVTLFIIRKQISRSKFVYGVLGFVLMLFNAWMGSIVVATNLFPILISIHYVAAYAVLFFFMLSIHQTKLNLESLSLMKFKYYYLMMGILSIVQVVLGTQLRHFTDEAVAKNILIVNEAVNFSFLGISFTRHWLMALFLIFISLVPLFVLRKKVERKWQYFNLGLSSVLIVQYFTGVVNLRYNFPLVAQVSHILFGGLVFGISLYICISIFKSLSLDRK